MSRKSEDVINRAIRYPGAFAMRIRIARLRLMGARIGNRCWVRRISVPRDPWEIELGNRVALDDDVVLLASGMKGSQAKIRIGNRTYVNRFTMFDASERIEVGSDCMIGPFCYITDHDHGSEMGEVRSAQPLVSEPVGIGDNVWIGAGATILKGVQLGDNAIIGAGAVVTHSVAKGQIVGGVPAQPIVTRRQ